MDPTHALTDTIAGSTGFLLWPGTWVLIDLLNAGDLAVRLRGLRVIELGSGTGLAGLCAAAAGASVLMTDLPSVVHGILDANTTRNKSAVEGVCLETPPVRSEEAGSSGSEVATMSLTPSGSLAAPSGMGSSLPSSLPGCWPGSLPVGNRGGSACCAALDWSEPLSPQVELVKTQQGFDMASADVILAIDVVWLKELLVPFR